MTDQDRGPRGVCSPAHNDWNGYRLEQPERELQKIEELSMEDRTSMLVKLVVSWPEASCREMALKLFY